MSQGSLVLPTSGIVSGLTFANDANSALDAVRSLWSGATAPSADTPEEGQRWLDTSVAGYMTYKVYDGTSWVAVFTVNTTTHAIEEAFATYTAVADAAYVATIYDRYIAYTSISTARAVTLPTSGTFPAGVELVIADESGSVNASKTITTAANTGDTLHMAAGYSAVIRQAYGVQRWRYNGSNKWTLVGVMPGILLPGIGGI